MRDFRRNTLRHIAATLIAIIIGMMICLLLSGCKTTEVVKEVPVVVEHTTTQHHTDIVRDTLMMRDSVYHYVQGDTVIIERWHHSIAINKVMVADTIHDTIPKVVTTTKVVTKEVPRSVKWWEIGIILICFTIVLFLCKRK